MSSCFTYDVNGCKDVLGLWINETESKSMLDAHSSTSCGLAALRILASCVYGWRVSGLEEGAKAVFPHATVQRCIVHLIRNSIRYSPRKQWRAVTKQLKLIYGAIHVKQARQDFEEFKTDWQAYPGAVSVWETNFSHVEQLYNYGRAVRKIMNTTNAIEIANSSFRKVTKKGAFPNEDAVFKIFYLRIQELYKNGRSSRRKLGDGPNQLLMDDRMSQLMQQYDVAY